MSAKKSSFYRQSLSVAVFCTVLTSSVFTGSAFGQDFKRPDGSVPLPMDWSSRHLIYTVGFTREQASKMQGDPRYFVETRLHGKALADESAAFGYETLPRTFTATRIAAAKKPPAKKNPALNKDWSVSLGAGGVAQGMTPAKFVFDVNAPPSCVNDYVVFPVNASTGNARAHVVGTFSTTTGSSSGSVEFTVTPTGESAVTLTLTASTTTNTGLDFEVSTTASSANATTEATNLAAAINRNLSSTVLGRIVAVASTNTVTVYTLTPGSRVTLSAPSDSGVANLSWGSVTAGKNGSQGNIVGLNELYSGSGSPLCTGLTYPEFIFSYASGVGPLATSPTISLSGTKIAYVENDPNIGAILHVLTFASGSTEHGSCTNNGTATPTCATAPVIPGSTSGSTATDFMLPLGLVGNATTGADSYSSPFINYSDDTAYIGDDNGYLYSVSTVFTGTPTQTSGFPATVNNVNDAITGLSQTTTTVTVTSSASASFAIGQVVTIASVAAGSGGCKSTAVADINGARIVTGTTSTTFTFTSADSTTIANGSCNLTNATAAGATELASPVVDVGGTGNIFVGDSDGFLYNYTSSGTRAAVLTVGTTAYTAGGGVRDGTIVDSTNAVGYVVIGCSGAGGESQLTEFSVTSTSLTPLISFGLNLEGCLGPVPMYDPTPDNNYFTKGISSSNTDNNGGMNVCHAGETHTDLDEWGFTSGVLNSTSVYPPNGYTYEDSFNDTGGLTCSPLTELYSDSVTYAITGLTQTTNTVTVTTATNAFVSGQVVTIAGVAAHTGGCTSAAVADINGEQTVTVTGTTTFTFPSALSTTINSGSCTLTSATATGPTQDYLFFGITLPEALTFTIPLTSGGSPGQLPLVTNTTSADVAGGTSGIMVDNDSSEGQASSLYFGTLGECATNVYCAIKLTQSGLD